MSTNANGVHKFCYTEGGSCSSARLCCDGKNATCVVQETSNDIYDYYDQDASSCYCDHGCLDVGDCCPDYKEYCGGKGYINIIIREIKHEAIPNATS